MDTYKLSKGSLRVIMKGDQVDAPIMQIMDNRKIATVGGDNKERYRILLSDGKYCTSFAVLSEQINEKVKLGELSAYLVIKINRYITSAINNDKYNSKYNDKRVLVILDSEVIATGDKVNKRIGLPDQLPDDEISGESSQALEPTGTLNLTS